MENNSAKLDEDAIQAQVANGQELSAADRIRAEVARLSKLDRAGYLAERKSIAKSLGVPASELDRLIAKGRNASNPRTGSAQSLGAEGAEDRSNERSNSQPVRTPDELYATAKDVIEAPDVLARVKDVIGKLGYAGDPTPVLLTYVVLSSRLGDKPINEHVIAQSAAGKNHTVNTALILVPDEAVLKITASTPKALIYSEEDLRHKTVVLAECDSLLALEGNAASLVRSIIEDARTDYDVVEKNPETGHNFTRRVSKEGPTGLITTGVRELEFQTSTRMLNVYLSDSPEQTRAVLRAEADIANGRAVTVPEESITKFHDFQRWLAVQPSSAVIVPFARILAEKIPAGEVRMRRDFKQLLAVIKAIALLNQHHRERDLSGRIIANLVDYRWARSLLLAAFKSIVGGGITDTIRQTVAAVPAEGEVSEADLVRTLGLTKSTVHYRVARALRGGWIQNLEKRKGYPFRLVRSVPLPEDDSPLPTIEELESELSAFEHPPYSNGHSNGSQTLGGVGESEQAFERSSEFGPEEADREEFE